MENDSNNCRLCLTANGTNVFNTFDGKSVNKNIASVIKQHFWFEITDKDVNKSICEVCWSKVDNFHSFYTHVYKIHNVFYSKVHEIIKVELDDENNTNFNENNNNNLGTIQVAAFDLEPKLEGDICEKDISVASDKLEDKFSDYGDISGLDQSDNVRDDNFGKNTSVDEDYDKKFRSQNSISLKKTRKSFVKKLKKDVDQEKMEEENKQIQEHFRMECELCSIRCETFQDIQFHYRKEHKIKGYLRCCKRKYRERLSLIEHIQRHLNPDIFKCDLCNKIYAHKRGLLEHRERHLSSEEKPFKCTKCSKTYTKKFILEKHLTTHKNEKTCICDDCGKSYGTKTLLQAHKKNIHGGGNIHICDVCAKEFRSKVVLEQHQKTVHENIILPKVQCQVCGIWLKHKHSLRKHMVLHEESKVDHFCSICGKQSLNRKALHNHIKTVHSDKIYKCRICEKTFKKQKSLKEHMATHTGFALYSCPHCPKTFNSSANMYSHKKKIHIKEWEEHERLKATGVL